MIIATAGHVDHGKTELVKTLTGIDTDRLPEERARGLSVDLGFAYHTLPDNTILGFVDVPGHEKFIRNMLAGVAGIDLGLLVVAADDGVMPQTREHVLLARQVGVPKLVVFLNKCDQVDDEELIELVEMEVRELLDFYEFDGENIPIVQGSALAALENSDEKLGKDAILNLMAEVDKYIPDPSRPLDKPFLMPVEDLVNIFLLIQRMILFL